MGKGMNLKWVGLWREGRMRRRKALGDFRKEGNTCKEAPGERALDSQESTSAVALDTGHTAPPVR